MTSIDPAVSTTGQRTRTGLQLVSGFLLLFGALATISGGKATWQGTRVLTWSATAGRIQSAIVQRDLIGVNYEKYSTVNVYKQQLHVEYSYTVAGKDYLGSQIDDAPGHQRIAANDKARYPVGADVRVHYNSHAPEVAVLETPLPAQGILTLVVGLVLLTFGLRIRR